VRVRVCACSGARCVHCCVCSQFTCRHAMPSTQSAQGSRCTSTSALQQRPTKPRTCTAQYDASMQQPQA
jgi:hypothetical protein